MHPDEPVYGAYDGPRNGRWITAVYVIRGDAIAEHVTDYGPVANFAGATPMMIPSFGDDTVAQLQDLAERNRNDDKWARYREELRQGSTLIKDILRGEEQLIDVVANRSIIGPAITIQRNR